MAKLLTNTTASDVFVADTGTTIPASGTYLILPQFYGYWANSANIVTLINAGTITVSNSLRSLPTAALMIAELAGVQGIAEDVLFDNRTDGFVSTNVQAAIEELNTLKQPKNTGFTQGSTVFISPTGVLAQDNANFFWDDPNNRLGLGTNTPSNTLTVIGPTTGQPPILAFNTGVNGANNALIAQFLAPNNPSGNNVNIEVGVANSTNNAAYLGFNYAGGSGSATNFLALGLYGSQNSLNVLGSGNVGVGTVSPASLLTVNGNTETKTLQLDGATSGAVTLAAASTTTAYTLKYPAAQGAANSQLTNDGAGNLFWTADASSTYFGDGSDGSVTLSSGVTYLSRTMYYQNLTVTGTASLITNGFKIFVNGTLTLSGSALIGSLNINGNNASGNTGGTSGGTGPGVEVGPGLAGASGSSAAGTSGIGYGGSGGAGGNGNNSNGGSGGVITYRPERVVRFDHFQSASAYKVGGAGGGSGGNGNASVLGAGGAGGAGGTGGGVVQIFARVFNNTSSYGLLAIGGNGGNGGNGSGGTGADGGGAGGGGGGGGFVYLISQFITAIGNINVAGGAGGSGGAGANGGPSGGNGTAGSSGHYSVYNGATGAWTVA